MPTAATPTNTKCPNCDGPLHWVWQYDAGAEERSTTDGRWAHLVGGTECPSR